MPEIRVIGVSGSIPTSTQLALGDIAINTYDGKLYIKKLGNTPAAIVEVVTGEGGGGSSISASYATTASYAENGGVTQILAGTNVTLSPTDGKGVVTVNAIAGGGGSGSPNGPLYSLQYNNGGLFSGSANFTLLTSDTLLLTGSLKISGSISGSLFGTASWANNTINAVTASYILNAISSSFATTASFARNAQTASYILNAESSSFASTASYWTGSVLNSISASYALSSSYASTASITNNAINAITASYVTLAQTASYVSNAVSSSFTETASFVRNAQTASYVVSAISASYVLNAISASFTSTASFVTLSQTASYVLNAVSSSFTQTASFTTLAQTASFTVNAQTASYVANAVSSSVARTASAVTVLNQTVTIGNITDTPANENTLNVYPPFSGGTGEGGQILLAASGGLYTSASMLDTWQDQFRVLRGSNTGGSNAGLLYMNLQTGNTQFVGAVTASAFSGLPNSYLYVSRTTNQTIPSGNWANRDILFNSIIYGNGISYDSGTGLASLTAGKVYRITARLAWNSLAVYLLQFSCYDSSDVQLGPTVEIVQASNTSNNISDGTLDFIYVPPSNTNIKIRTTANTTALSGEYIRGDLNTQLIIQQIA
jgi:hypothetical protein